MRSASANLPVGVRKRTNSKYYFYRIKCKLPSGEEVAEEHGGFATPEEAALSRSMRFAELLRQEIKVYNKTFGEVYEEFLSAECSDKIPLQEKYNTLYQARLHGLADIAIEDISLRDLDWIANHFNMDSRNQQKKKLTYSYINAVKALLWRVFDYAYNQGYVSNHILYQMPRMWGKEPTEKQSYIQPLFAYMGNKHRLMADLKTLYPKDIENLVFVDLFAGSATVAVNTSAKKIIINEKDDFFLGIYHALSATPSEIAWQQIMGVVEKYNLCAENEMGYYKCRDDYNRIPYQQRVREFWYWSLALVYHSFNRSTVQHNRDKEYNAPFGKEKCNIDLMKRRFFPFAEKLYKGQYEITYIPYNEFQTDTEDVFYYVDPPYFASTATYNKEWDEQNEHDLYAFLDNCHDKGVRWMLSNALENNGNKNLILADWLKKSKRKYKVFYLDRNYKTSNFRRKNKGKTIEIAVINY